jgi:hypothetical protein
MRAFYLGLLLAALPASGKMREDEFPAPVTLYTQFEQEPSEAAMAALKAELASIMDPIGFSFEWRSLAGATGREVSVELVVLTVKGKCVLEAGRRLRSEAGALGWTHVSDGDVLPFVGIDCGRITHLIGTVIHGQDEASRDLLLGRAMARVLAHELYHVVARTARHGTGGVAKPFYTAAELTADEFYFERKEANLLRGSAALDALTHSVRTQGP